MSARSFKRGATGAARIAAGLLVMAAGCTTAPAEKEPAAGIVQAPPPVPVESGSPDAIPNVLIIGDSISIGYTPIVKEILAGRANVVHPKANCADTPSGLKNLDAWLGDTHWDMIQFNWGLHDLCYRSPGVPASRDKKNGRQAVSPADYEKNLETLVKRLEKTGAKLVWASTTLVPENEAGRFAGDDVKYNAIAARVMKRHHIAVNDLYAISKKMSADLFAAPGNVHYTKAGYRLLAEQVARVIAEKLKLPKTVQPSA